MMSKIRNKKNREAGTRQHCHESVKVYRSLLLPSLLGILACMVCLAGMTWAWFSVTLTANVADIRSAAYSQEVEVQESGSTNLLSEVGEGEPADNMAEYSSEEGVYTAVLTRGKSYDIRIATSEDTQVGGYCVISGDGQSYYIRLDADGECFITIFAAEGSDESDASVEYSFKPCWGEPSEDIGAELSDGDYIGAAPQFMTAATGDNGQSEEPSGEAPNEDDNNEPTVKGTLQLIVAE